MIASWVPEKDLYPLRNNPLKPAPELIYTSLAIHSYLLASLGVEMNDSIDLSKNKQKRY